MEYNDDSLLQLSGIQHFAFCPRQWALIHIENQWAENVHTVEGDIFHERAHGEERAEKRGDVIVLRGVRVFSEMLGVTGKCDVVEFRRSTGGVELHGREGLWQPYPVEYKKGGPKEGGADELQLCCQAMCLEEMLACRILEGSLFYGEPRRRTRVELTPELRSLTEDMLKQMRAYYVRGYTPRPKRALRCKACSLADICLPRLETAVPVKTYIKTVLEETS